jgi:hypothetical protein
VTRSLVILTDAPGIRAIREDSLSPELRAYHPRRTGDLVVFTDPPRAIAEIGPQLAPRRQSRMALQGIFA